MLDNYGGGETTAQASAVATLMLLCGQALAMDYTTDGSSAGSSIQAMALRRYFGYDETVRIVERNTFGTNEWESLIYTEIANGRPVLYGGYSSGGGHAFVVDGYDGNGLFHVNWGWGGLGDSYFLLSILNPSNNDGIGSSSSMDGYSLGQTAVVGIQHDTGEKVAELLTVLGISHGGSSTYTRSSSSDDFTDVGVNISVLNKTGDTHEFALRMALLDADGQFISWPMDYLWIGDLNDYWGFYDLNCTLSFGAGLPDGDYYLYVTSFSENSEAWEMCWGSNVYFIKATISGNTLTLTEPTIDLSGSDITTEGNTDANSTVKLRTTVKNNGTNFNDYVYVYIDGNMVGGRMFEIGEGATAVFDFDFIPTTSGSKQVIFCYEKDNEKVPFAYGTVTITEEKQPNLTATVTLTNANGEGNIEDSAVNVSAVLNNTGQGAFNNYIGIDLYKYDATSGNWLYLRSEESVVALAAGGSKEMTATFDNLEADGTYLVLISYLSGNAWVNIPGSMVSFIVDLEKEVVLTADNKTREYGEDNPALTYSVTGDGVLDGTPAISTTATKTSPVGEYDIVVDRGSVTNRKLTMNNGILTIAKAPLTVAAKSYEIKQGDELPVFEVEYTGFKNGETNSVLTLQPTITCVALSDSEPGVYDIVVGGAEAWNYSITYVPGLLTIVQTTGIDAVGAEDQPFDVYSVAGGKVRHQVTTLKGLPAGIYVVNGQKVIVK